MSKRQTKRWSSTWVAVVVMVGMQVLTVSCQRTGQPAAPAAAPATAPVAAPAPTTAAPAVPAAIAARVLVQVTEEGFVPSRIPAEAGKPITLAITRKTEKTCATEILFKGQKEKTDLPLNKEVEVTYTPQTSGKVLFGCAMGMMVGGALEVR